MGDTMSDMTSTFILQAKNVYCLCFSVMPQMEPANSVIDEYEVLLQCRRCGRVWSLEAGGCKTA